MFVFNFSLLLLQESPKKPLSGQLSAPIISPNDDNNDTIDVDEPIKEEEPSTENVPPPKVEEESKKEAEKKVTLRDKPVNKDSRGATTQSCVVPGPSAGKVGRERERERGREGEREREREEGREGERERERERGERGREGGRELIIK